ncbi:MAG: metal ABC transporter permease [Chloroflexota bacterium]
MIELILEPLQYDFILRGLVAVVIVGSVCGIIGTYVVLRGMAFFGDALAHAILPGVAIGYLMGGGAREPLFWWAMGTAIVSSLTIGAISRSTKIKSDTAIGIIFASMFALGVALISTVRSYTVDLTHFLFGNVLGVSSADLRLIAIFSLVIVLIVFAFYKEFLVLSFDPILAATLRLPAKVLDYLLLIMIAVTIVISLQTVGITLLLAMLVTPAATSSLHTHRLPVIMLLAAMFASISGVIGLYLSYYWNISSGAAIVLTTTVFFVLSWIVKKTQGMLKHRTAS